MCLVFFLNQRITALGKSQEKHNKTGILLIAETKTLVTKFREGKFIFKTYLSSCLPNAMYLNEK